MSRENPSWGVPRTQSELVLLGQMVSEATVRQYRIRPRTPPSQTWRTFLDNHLSGIVAIDFFTVPTATFRILFASVVLRHDRRMVVHFNVTANPTAEWTAQQIVEAFPEDEAPRFLLRHRDGIYGNAFPHRVRNMGIEQVVAAPRSPRQNAYAERLAGSIRRECLNRVVVLNERHLGRILSGYFDYYHRSRTHLSWDRNSPIKREVEPPERGEVITIPQVGGLHLSILPRGLSKSRRELSAIPAANARAGRTARILDVCAVFARISHGLSAPTSVTPTMKSCRMEFLLGTASKLPRQPHLWLTW